MATVQAVELTTWPPTVPAGWTARPLWSMFERIKNVDHPDEQMLSVFPDFGVVAKSSRDNLNQTAEYRSIYQLVHPGWLVTNRMKAWQGSVGISSLRGIVSGHYICFAPRHTEDPEYLNWLFRSVPYTHAYGLISRGVRPGQVEIDNDAYRQLPVLVPPVDEQRAIADFLDRETARIDTLIVEQQRLVDLLRERRAVTIKAAVPDARSDGADADKLARRVRIGNGSTPRRESLAFWENGHIPWLNSAVVNKDRVRDADQFVTDAAAAQCHLPLVSRGSILVALTGQGKTRGTATILDIDATINQHMAYVTPDPDFWDSEYLLWVLTAAYAELRAISDENGSTNGALTCEDIKRFRVAHLHLDEQRRIATYLDEQGGVIAS